MLNHCGIDTVYNKGEEIGMLREKSKGATSFFKTYLLYVFVSSQLVCCNDGRENAKKEILEACALYSSCTYELEPLPLGKICADFLTAESSRLNGDTWGQLYSERYECCRAADNCDELRSCLYANSAQREVCESEYDDKCSGNVFVDCNRDEAEYEIQDCGSAGLICSETEFSAKCGANTCDATADAPFCDGNSHHECDVTSTALAITDCSVLGGTCGQGPDGKLTCTGDDEECQPGDLAMHCEGNVLTFCLYSKVARLDCSEVYEDGLCFERETGAVCGLGDECQWSSSEECVDGVISFCLLGRPAEIDCRQYGNYDCDTFYSGDKQGAYCTPSEKSACDRIRDVQKEICAVADKCFPCACVLSNEGWEIPMSMGMPDIRNASCTGSFGRCEGEYLAWAERCLALGRPEPGEEGWEVSLFKNPSVRHFCFLGQSQ